jgi:hypothetical protein
MHLKMHHISNIYKIIVITTYKNRRCTSVTKFNGAITTICVVAAIQPQLECHVAIAHGLIQLRSARGGSPTNARMRSARGQIQSNGCKKNQTSSRIEYGGDADRIGDVEEVLKSGGIRAEKTGDLNGSDDGAFRSGLRRGGRRGWDRQRHPDLQACRVNASSSYALPLWTPSCHCDRDGETLAWDVDRDGSCLGWWHGQGNTSMEWCVGVLI